MCAPLGDDRRVGRIAIVRLIIRSSSGIRLHKQKAQPSAGL